MYLISSPAQVPADLYLLTSNLAFQLNTPSLAHGWGDTIIVDTPL